MSCSLPVYTVDRLGLLFSDVYKCHFSSVVKDDITNKNRKNLLLFRIKNKFLNSVDPHHSLLSFLLLCKVALSIRSSYIKSNVKIIGQGHCCSVFFL